MTSFDNECEYYSIQSSVKMDVPRISPIVEQENKSEVVIESLVHTVAVQLKIPSELSKIPTLNFSNSDSVVVDDVQHLLDASDDIDEQSTTEQCSNCLRICNPKSEECFDKDDCGHLLCIGCRFMQDVSCKICTGNSEEVADSNALDLTTSCVQELKVSNCACGKASNVKESKVVTKPERFILPSYIDILPKNENNEVSYRCSICKKVFSYKFNAKYHEACYTGERPLKCDLCDKRFIKKSHLEYHVISHSGIKPFKCNICGKGFVQKNKLNRHVIIHSAFNKQFKCQICDVTFSQKHGLNEHRRTHSTERPYKCKHCRRRFSRKSNLMKHELRHSGIKNYVCEDCGKSFVLKQHLMSHRKIHSDIRSHVCKECGRAFVERKDLIRHMQIHTDTERDYECSICIMAFRRKDNLERHMKNIHPESITKYGRPQHIVSVVKVDNNVHLDSGDSGKCKIVNSKSKVSISNDEKNLSNTNLEKGNSDKTSDTKSVENSVINKVIATDNVIENEHNKSTLKADKNDNLLCSLENVKTGFNNLENNSSHTITLPKCQKVSVISSTKSYVNESRKMPKIVRSNNENSKKSETLAPYRLITPPTMPVDWENGNCVPTITKVTHIVHTSLTGVPNVKTLITTRNVTEKSLKKTKEKRLSVEGSHIENQSGDKSHDGVIKYVSRSKSNSCSKYKCYRILKVNNSNQSFTTSHNISNNNNNNCDMPFTQSSDVANESILSESISNAGNVLYTNQCFDGYQPSLNVLNMPSNANPKINTSDNCCNVNIDNNIYNGVVENNFHQFDEDTNVYSLNKVYNQASVALNRNLAPYNNISESCLLADNVLEDSITAYMDEVNSSHNIYQSDQDSFVGNRSNVLEQICPSNYSPTFLNTYNPTERQTLQNVSLPQRMDYNCINNIADKMVNDGTREHESYLEYNLIEQQACNFMNSSSFSECGAQELVPLNSDEFRDESSFRLHDLIKHTSVENVRPVTTVGLEQKTCESNGLFTLANMACARANLSGTI